MSPTTVLKVAVPSPLYRVFDYLPPKGCDIAHLRPGVRLRLPFGRSNTVGVLLEIADHSDFGKLKPAHALLDETPVIPGELMQLLIWAADYYHHPIGEVMATALPVLLRQGETAKPQQRRRWQLTDEGRAVDAGTLTRAKRQAEMLRRLQATNDGLSDDQLREMEGQWSAVLKAMEEKGWITVKEENDLTVVDADSDNPPELNPGQAEAVASIIADLDQFQAALLDGVTGSGKTEVYLRIIEKVLAQGRQAMVLVPEITLTPQLVTRFQRRFKVPMAILHSGLNDRERLNAWLHAGSGDAPLIIGTRSAVFTPMARPGVIIIDEEHDPSFKQQSGFRYSARDLALVRGRNLSVPVIMGSATPSFESLFNARQGRYHYLHLPQRAGSAKPPRVELLDVRQQKMEEQLSAPLLKRMGHHLARDGQVLLFLNRRGFAPTLICHECGWVAECRRCDAHMTLHQRSGSLRCHHCGSQRPVVRQCPECGSVDLRPIGSGTERIEETLAQHFPEVGVARLDRDSTRRKGSIETILDGVNRGEQRILIGTQMLAKGHHFPNITLVGILDGDQGLFGSDFRAGERMAQLIVQVAGRAGRAERPGEVVIQTHHPDHPLLSLLKEKGYAAFADAALAERQLTALPPYSHMAVLRVEAGQQALPTEFLEMALAAGEALAIPGVELYGPLPSPLERVAGKYRAQLLIQSEQRPPLHQLLKALIPQLGGLPTARKVRWSIDVDPVDLS